MKKSAITLLIFLIMIISVSAVSAADDASDLGAADTDALSIDNTDTVTADVSVKNFTELQHEIADASYHGTGNLELSSDYVRNTTETNLITIDDNIVIDGKGHSINGTGSNLFLFNVTGSLTLKNVILYGEEDIILNSGSLTVDNVTFHGPLGIYVEENSLGEMRTLNVVNSVFNKDVVRPIDVEGNATVSLSNNVFDNKTAPFLGLGTNCKVTSPTTVDVESAGVGAKWNEIDYKITARDDKGNLIVFDDGWSLKVNDKETPITTAIGSLEGTANAESYGANVISGSNSALTAATIKTATVNIVPPETPSVIDFKYAPITIYWNNTVNLTVSIKDFDSYLGSYHAKGKVSLIIPGINNDNPIVLDLNENGTAYYQIKNIGVGNYSVTIDYDGDGVFLANQSALVNVLEVIPVAPTINITVDNTTIGHPEITIVLPGDAVGFVNATIDGTKVVTNGELQNGKYPFTADVTPKDSAFSIVVDYKPKYDKSQYTAASKTFEFYADYLTTDVIIGVENKTYGNNVSFTVTLANGVDKVTVNVTKGTKVVYNATVNLTAGSATIDLGKLAAGNYNIKATSVQNSVYKVAVNETSFNVAPIAPVVAIDNTAAVLFENVTVTVTVTNYKNGTITLKDGTTVLVQNLKLDKNGVAKYNITNIKVGEHLITAIWNPDVDSENYTAANSNKTINVAKLNPTINVAAEDVLIDGSAHVVINLTNGDKTAPTGEVYITKADGQLIYNAQSLVDGVHEADLDSALFTELGDYTINVWYKGDTNYNAGNKLYTLKVVKRNVNYIVEVTNITTKDVANIKVTAGVAGAPAFNQTFTVKVIGVNNDYNNVTSAKLTPGVESSFEYKLQAGVYKVEVSYNGDDKYNKNTTTSDNFIVRGIIENLTVFVDNVTYPAQAVAIVNASVAGKFNVTISSGTQGIKNYTVDTVKVGNDYIGKVNIDVPLAADDANAYTATVISIMDNYDAVGNATTFYVKKGNITATLTIKDVVYGNNATAVVTANVDGNYTVKVEGVDYTVTVVDGTGSIDLNTSALDANKYTVELTAPVNGNYTNSGVKVNETDFTITNANITIKVTVDNVKYDNPAIVVIESNADGIYTVKVLGKPYTVTVVNGTGNTTLDVLTPQDNVRVQVNATIKNYNPVYAQTNYNVELGEITFYMDIPDVYYTNATTGNASGILVTNVPGFNASAKAGYQITLVGGNFTVYINGNSTDNTFTLPILPVGTYTVKATPIANDTAFKYYDVAGVYNTTEFRVKDGSINLTVSVADITYPDPAQVVIKTNVTGSYTLTIGDYVKPVNLTANQEKTVNVTGLDVGIYTATVSCNIANYTAVSESDIFTVKTADIHAVLKIADVPFATQPVAIITSDNTEGAFTVTVNGKSYTVNVVNGTGNTTITEAPLYVGQYTATWTAEIKNYNPFVGAPVKFNVTKAKVNLTIKVANVEYPNQAVATVYANIPGIYNVTVDGYSYNVTVDATGKNTQIIDLLDVKNNYEATVDILEINGNYTGEKATTKFNVTIGTPVIEITNVNASYQALDNVTIVINVPYGTGTVNITDSLLGTLNATAQLVNETVSYTIENVSKLGLHTIFVTLNDKNFVSKMAQVSFDVTAIPTNLTIPTISPVYEDNVIIALNITGLVNGTAPTGSIVVAGYSATEPASASEIKLNLGKLAAGNYTISISYSGDAIYAGCTVPYSFTVAKFTPEVNATATVTAATYPGKVKISFISNRTGNFTIDLVDEEGKVQTIKVGTVNNNTQTTKEITGLAAGKYTANVNYLGNENYANVTNKTEFTIKQATATINANVTGADYPAKATVTVVATQNGTYIINVIDKAGAIADTQSGDLVADKITTVKLDVLDAGDYTVNVTFESANYTAAPVQKALTINKGVPTINIEALGATYPETGIVKLISDATGKYTLTVGTFTTNGTLTVDQVEIIPLPILGANDYDVVVNYAENDNYNATTATGKLTIAKGTPDISMSVDTTKIGENANVTITIQNATGIVTVNGKNVALVDGTAIYNIGILKAQTYDITAVYGGDANYTVGNKTLTFTVNQLPANLVVTVTNTTFGTNPAFSITLDDKGDVEVKVIIDGKYEDYLHVSNGAKSGHISNLHAGEHNWTVVYKGSDIYEAETQTVYFNIAKADIKLEVTAIDAIYPNGINFTVSADANGTYNLTVGKVTHEVNLIAGVPLSYYTVGAPAGTYTITLSSAETRDYNAASANATATIAKAPVTITVNASDVTYGSDVVAYVTADVSGKYTVALGTLTTQIVDLVAGEAKEVVFAKVNAGNYTITAACEETQNYTAASATADVKVAKADVTLDITAADVTYPSDVVVTVTSNVAGNYSVFLGTTSPKYVTLEANVAQDVVFKGLNAGTYEFTLAYTGSDNYNAAAKSTNVTVAKSAIVITIDAPDVTYPADVVVTVTSNVAGDYNYTFDGTTQTIALEAGVAKVITEAGKAAGTYNITVARAETQDYSAVTQTASVTVAKSENTTMTIEATSPLAGENATVTVTLPADATGNVTVKYGNGVYEAPVVNGVATVSVPTAVAGTETATVSYSGDNNYAPASGEVQITVKANGIIIAENIKRGVNSPYDYYATLVDGNNIPVSGVEITFTIAGKTYKATTNASGIAAVSAGLGLVDDKDTKYDVIVTNPFTLENTTATTTIVPRLIVVSGDLTADYLENPPYVVQAIGDDGNPVGAGETVKVVFAGFYYDMLTNATGHVVRTIGLAPGQYAVKACYQGYNTTATVFTVKQVMKVTSGTLKKTAKTYTLKATLKSSNGKALVGKEVSLTFNGKTYNVKTNSKGVASYTLKSSVISKLTAGKTYTLKAKYVNDVRKGKIKVVSK